MYNISFSQFLIFFLVTFLLFGDVPKMIKNFNFNLIQFQKLIKKKFKS